MDGNEAKTMMEALAELMDESHEEAQSQDLGLYNEIRQLINNELVAAVEEIAYEKKYEVIASANALADAIGLYLNYPELQNKYVIGFYNPDAAQTKSIYAHYLESFQWVLRILGIPPRKTQNRVGDLSDTIPTVITYGVNQGKIRALNLAEKQIPLSSKSYELLEQDKNTSVELTGILYAYHLCSSSVQDNQAVVILPRNADRQQAYHKVLFNALDVLVLQNADPDWELTALIRSGNIKEIFSVGNGANSVRSLSALAKELDIKLTHVEKISDVYTACQAAEMNAITNNFSNSTLMESKLCGVLWYLAQQKKILQERVAQINNDLVNNTEALKQIKNLQINTSQKLSQVDKCAEMFYSAMRGILERIQKLQRIYGMEETVNRHEATADYLLELLAAEGTFFRYYKKNNANDHIRSIKAMCEQAEVNRAAVQVLVNDYFSEPQMLENLRKFAGYETRSSLLLKKKLSMHKQLYLTLSDCEQMILQLDLPISPLEYRLLGEAQFQRGETAKAKENLKNALAGGDLDAGEFLFKYYGDTMAFLADNGVPKAAYEYGRAIYREECSQGYQSDSLDKAVKYLNIAASQRHPEAMELLGNIYYEKAMTAGSERRKTLLNNALRHYTEAEKIKAVKKTVLERIGMIYNEQENYQNAKKYLEKAKTAQALFILGQMYENGHGIAANEETALEYYEEAVNAGHAQAQVEYSRLSTKIEAEKQKTTVTSNTSYYSYSYYSGYYSSYYSSSW